jgi:hypothetical protein
MSTDADSETPTGIHTTAQQLHPAEMLDRADPPHGLTWRGYLVQLLYIASSIEHALMVQYLFAAYSLGGEHVTGHDNARMVARWRNLILSVAKEEMGHMLTVQNVLCLLGAPVDLMRSHSWGAGWSPFPFNLERLTLTSLMRYVQAEIHDIPVIDSPFKRFLEKFHPTPGPGDLPHSAAPHVGELYRQIIALISRADRIADSEFHEDSFHYQACWDDWGRGHNYKIKPAANLDAVVKRIANNASEQTRADVLIERVATRQQAALALTRIAEQGEAAPSELAGSHFQRFWSIFSDFRTAEESHERGWTPTYHVAENPHTPLPQQQPASSASTITWPRSQQWAGLFDLRYGMLLNYISHSFQLARGGDGELLRGAVVHKAFAEMYNLKAIAGILVQLPLKSPADERRAGPPFQMPPTLTLPTESIDRWRLHGDLLRTALKLNLDLQHTTDRSCLDEELPYLRAMHQLDVKSVAWIEQLIAGHGRDGDPS